jgi:hypothetical protein
MTMTMSPLMSEHEQPPPGGRPDEPQRLLAMPTHEIRLSPEFVKALKSVAPKARRRKLPYILALAFLVAAGSLAVVPTARHRVAAAAYRLWHRDQPAAAVVPSASAPAQPTASAQGAPSAVVAAPTIVIPPVVISSAGPDTSSSSPTKPSKPPGKWQRQSPR